MTQLYIAVENGSLGRIYTSADGSTWTLTFDSANVTFWNCLTRGPDDMWLAGGIGADGEAWLGRSFDNGLTWADTAFSYPTELAISGLAWNSSFWVATTWAGHVFVSSDGVGWTVVTTGLEGANFLELDAIAWDGTQFVVVGTRDVGGVVTGVILTSPDAETWTLRTQPSGWEWVDHVIYGGTLWIISGDGGIATSSDGITWTERDTVVRFANVSYGQSQYVATGTTTGPFTGHVRTSPNGITWTARTPPTDLLPGPNIYGDQWIISGTNVALTGSRIGTSVTAVSWTSATIGWNAYRFGYWSYSTFTANAVLRATHAATFTANAVIINTALTYLYVAVGDDGKVATSTNDGSSWTNRSVGLSNDLFSVASDGDMFITTTQFKTVARATDVTTTWIQETLPSSYSPGYDVRNVAYNGVDTWVVVDTNSDIFTSPDGDTWTQRRNDTSNVESLYDVCWDSFNEQFVAVGDTLVGDDFSGEGLILTSPNGITWTQRTGPVAEGGWPPFKQLTSVAANSTGTIVVIRSTSDVTTLGPHKIAYSTDAGVTWTALSATPFRFGSVRPFVVEYGDRFMVGGTHGSICWSFDGITWSDDNTTSYSSDVSVFAFTYTTLWIGGGRYGVDGSGGWIGTSTSGGVNWTPRSNPFGSASINGLANTSSFQLLPFFSADAVFRKSTTSTRTADAVIAMPYFRVDAVIRIPETLSSHTFTANAVIVFQTTAVTTSSRNRHDRGQWHFDTMYATDVAHGPTDRLEDVLRDLWERMSDLEG